MALNGNVGWRHQNRSDRDVVVDRDHLVFCFVHNGHQNYKDFIRKITFHVPEENNQVLAKDFTFMDNIRKESNGQPIAIHRQQYTPRAHHLQDESRFGFCEREDGKAHQLRQ
ncbi:hypothetical protein BV898_00052 [Hypsibius exemplaris]|uniref:Uncharacterized protein n=1 Tax=Hypsibius exemplaris TaxID=2072580 RepID=A0A1W0XEK5_HYPEX|nr:hypothetical protein BV898_00052 [Hypsibius exemplaris]